MTPTTETKMPSFQIQNESCIFVFTEKLYNVDEALLSSMEEKQRILSEEMERLEKESHTVR